MATHRGTATHVSAFQFQCEAFATSRCPTTQHPRVSVTLVFASVSSMKTRWRGSPFFCCCFHGSPGGRRRRGPVRLGVQPFCKALIKTDRYVPYAIIADLYAPPMQFRTQFAQHDVGLLGEACLQPVSFPHHNERTSATRRARENAAAAALPVADRRHHTFTKIQSIRSAHECRSPLLPASWIAFLGASEAQIRK